MRNRTKIIVGGLTAALALAAAVGTATATRLELSGQRFLVLIRELTFESSAELQVVCSVNLEGSFHSRALSKVSNALIGSITQATIHREIRGRCTRNTAWTLTTAEGQGETLPWHMLYLAFEGTLPSITGVEISIDNGAFKIEAGSGITCLYLATAREPIKAIFRLEGGGKVSVFRANEATRIPRSEGIALCPERMALKGSGLVGAQETWVEVSIRLVT